MDAFKNFSKATVSTGYDDNDTSIVLTTGHGAKLPAAPFTATWWNATDYPDPSDDPNVEIVRCTAKATDTLTVTRAQDGTAATNKNTSAKVYKMIVGVNARTMDDLRTVYVGGAPFWNAKHVAVIKENFTFSTGENDLYTVPTGRKALVLVFAGYNNSGTSPTIIPKFKISGTYYRAGSGVTFTSGTNTTTRTSGIPLEAGESFSLNFSTGIAATMQIKILEFDAQSPVVFARMIGTIVNGNNTLYTCPAGYSATPLSALDFTGAGSTAVGIVSFANDSGGARTIKLHLVNSGGTASADNYVIASQNAGSAALTSMQAALALNAGDFIAVESDSSTATQSAWAIIFESPLPQ